jgi:hypothetical protein
MTEAAPMDLVVAASGQQAEAAGAAGSGGVGAPPVGQQQQSQLKAPKAQTERQQQIAKLLSNYRSCRWARAQCGVARGRCRSRMPHTL